MTPAHFSEGSVIATLLGWLGKLGWKSIQRDRQLLSDIHSELTIQRTNCLATIQNNTAKQAEILESINEKLSEQNGYIRGYLESKH